MLLPGMSQAAVNKQFVVETQPTDMRTEAFIVHASCTNAFSAVAMKKASL